MNIIWEILSYIWTLQPVKSFQHQHKIFPFKDIYPSTLYLYMRLWNFFVPTLLMIMILRPKILHGYKFQHFSLTCHVLPHWLQHSFFLCSCFFTWLDVVVVAPGSLLLLLLVDDSFGVDDSTFTNLMFPLFVLTS